MYLYKKKNLLFLFTFLIAIFFGLNFYYRFIKIAFYKIKDLIILKDYFLVNEKSYKDSLKQYECLPKLIKKIPVNSSVIIGHAYGRANLRRFSNEISPSVKKFILRNNNNIDTIFFTGDVFSVPTYKKWEKLYNDFSDDNEIFIIPGNHDVGNNNKNNYREIFNNYISKKQSILFPYLVKRSGFNIILDDSTKGNSLFNNNFEILLNTKYEDNIILLRHHILLKEMQKDAGNTPEYFDNSIIESNFNYANNTYFISGNGGMKKYYKRISCIKNVKYNYILNGIGEFKNDNVLILNNKKIYRYEINNY